MFSKVDKTHLTWPTYNTGFKCFLVVFVRSVHFVDLNHVSFQPSDNRYLKCLCSTSLVIKQTDSIALATSDN